ncbi:NLI interacting factor-like phosphatase-domain-containing protein [Pavlovales sp. CCMP2436]|nr:NLI interacting factor-like phosphatase-domain-containing protein [Pavlovales sp. CCMP2436]
MLILDLDNTLVHAASESATTQYEHLTHDVVRFTVPKDDTTGERHYNLKLVTGLANFLARAHEVFDLSMYTHGLAGYVTQILKIIDPSGVSFNGRVVKRGLDYAMGDRIKKLELVSTLAKRNQLHQAIIVDDRDDVLQDKAISCVLLSRPFYFFDTPATISPLMQGSTKWLERYPRADPESGEQLDWTLNSTLVAVEKVCAEMARLGANAKVCQAVENVRMRILEGVVVVFAGGLIQEKSSTQESTLWKTTERAFPRRAGSAPLRLCAGARGDVPGRVYRRSRVTHELAGPIQAGQVDLARGSQQRIHVVNPNWLFECLYRSEWVLEEDYPLTNGVPHTPLERQPSASWIRGVAGGEGAAVRRTDPRVDPHIANNTRVAYGSLAGPSPPGTPRGQSAPQAPWLRVEPLKLPLHELEARLDAKLCKLVGPLEHTALLGHIKRVRDEDADQSDRESSLTSIVQMVGPENIELICLQLGFIKPSDKPTKLLNPSGYSNGR